MVGSLIWIFERRDNEHYGGSAVRGFVAGAWWSAIAMTQAGTAQQGLRSTPGRLLAVIWMVASVVTIAVFIAGITSALTTQRLQGVVRTANDLRSVRVGAVAGSSTVDFLTEQQIAFHTYPSAAEGLRAAQSGEIDAFVYDRPLLAWMLEQDFPRLELTQITLDSQNYAIALPLNNTVRKELDVELLRHAGQSMVGPDAVSLPRPRRRELSDRIASHSYGLVWCRQRALVDEQFEGYRRLLILSQRLSVGASVSA